MEHPGRWWILIFLVAVATRAALLSSWMIPRGYVIAPYHVEAEKVASNLVESGRYADPYLIPTGPTAHPLPIHTGLLAISYKLFGLLMTSWLRAALGIGLIAAMLAMLPWLAEALGLGAKAGVAGGLVGAFLPLYGLGEMLGWLWTEALTGIVLGLLLVWFLRRWARLTPIPAAHSMLLGVASGLAFHLSPPLMPVVAGCAAFELGWRRDPRKLRDTAVIVLGILLACVPWGWRNVVAFDEFFFVRSNFGLELRISNNDDAAADLWHDAGPLRHPGRDLAEARQVAELGEIEYMRRARSEALAWIRTHPGRFLRLTAGRFWHIWFGPPLRPVEALPIAGLTLLAAAGAWRALGKVTMAQRAAIAIPLATFPLVYYFVGYSARYVFPLHGLLLMLAGSAVAECAGWLRPGARLETCDGSVR